MPHVTPDTLPNRVFVRLIAIPDEIEFSGAVSGALNSLTDPENWEQLGTITPEQCAERAMNMVESYLNSGLLGIIVPYATATPPPFVLPCDGSVYNRVDYPDLYDLIDPTFQIDADTFRTPDLQGRVLLGSRFSGGGFSPGDTGGEEEVTLTALEMPAHTHTNTPHTHIDAGHTHAEGIAIPATHSIIPPDLFPSAVPGLGSTAPGFANIQSASVAIDNTGGGQAHNNMQPYLALKYGIYYA